MSAPEPSTLSHEQRAVLEWLFDNIPVSTCPPWGVRWRPGKWGVTNDPSRRAAYSRMLKRLEARGLILRQNQVSGNPLNGEVRTSGTEPHNRTTHVFLTDLGVQVASRLTNDTCVLLTTESTE